MNSSEETAVEGEDEPDEEVDTAEARLEDVVSVFILLLKLRITVKATLTNHRMTFSDAYNLSISMIKPYLECCCLASFFSTRALVTVSEVELIVFHQWLSRKSRSVSVMSLEECRDFTVMSKSSSRLTRKRSFFFR